MKIREGPKREENWLQDTVKHRRAKRIPGTMCSKPKAQPLHIGAQEQRVPGVKSLRKKRIKHAHTQWTVSCITCCAKTTERKWTLQ